MFAVIETDFSHRFSKQTDDFTSHRANFAGVRMLSIADKYAHVHPHADTGRYGRDGFPCGTATGCANVKHSASASSGDCSPRA